MIAFFFLSHCHYTCVSHHPLSSPPSPFNPTSLAHHDIPASAKSQDIFYRNNKAMN